jgi:hypothetical protein
MPDSRCLHVQAGVRLNDLLETEICAVCGVEIEGLDADEAGGGS